MTLYRIRGKSPAIAPSAFVAPEATLVGDVSVGEHASLWFGAIARGDNEPIRIGASSNIQEGAVLHADPGYPLTIGEGVTVGHQAMLHGCSIGNGSLIGIQAVVMNGAVIGANSIVGAGAVVTERKVFPERSMILGAPGKMVRALTNEEVAALAAAAQNYVNRTAEFNAELERVG